LAKVPPPSPWEPSLCSNNYYLYPFAPHWPYLNEYWSYTFGSCAKRFLQLFWVKNWPRVKNSDFAYPLETCCNNKCRCIGPFSISNVALIWNTIFSKIVLQSTCCSSQAEQIVKFTPPNLPCAMCHVKPAKSVLDHLLLLLTCYIVQWVLIILFYVVQECIGPHHTEFMWTCHNYGHPNMLSCMPFWLNFVSIFGVVCTYALHCLSNPRPKISRV
jgi:hypothetical protein